MEACVRHLRTKTSATGNASLLLVQDTLETLGHPTICCEVAILLASLASLHVHHTRVPFLLRSGGIAVAIVGCSESDTVCAYFGVSL